MSPRRAGRTERCDTAQARIRLEQARAFLDAAELVGLEEDEVAAPGVAASLAVLAGIAASDAACCANLGTRARGQDHRQTIDLLGQVADSGKEMARDLARLLAVKDDAHHGLLHVSGQRAATALRQARRIVDAADRAFR